MRLHGLLPWLAFFGRRALRFISLEAVNRKLSFFIIDWGWKDLVVAVFKGLGNTLRKEKLVKQEQRKKSKEFSHLKRFFCWALTVVGRVLLSAFNTLRENSPSICSFLSYLMKSDNNPPPSNKHSTRTLRMTALLVFSPFAPIFTIFGKLNKRDERSTYFVC